MSMLRPSSSQKLLAERAYSHRKAARAVTKATNIASRAMFDDGLSVTETASEESAEMEFNDAAVAIF
jgi:hypothetical protein